MSKAYKSTSKVRVENKAAGWIGALGKAEEPSRTLSGTQGDDNAAQRVKAQYQLHLPAKIEYTDAVSEK